MYPQIFFENTFRNFDVISGVKRHIKISEVLSELYCVLLRRRQRLEKRNFSRKRPTHILKTRFLSLRYGAVFRRSRLVSYLFSLADLRMLVEELNVRKRAYVTVYQQAISPCGRYLAACDSFGRVSVFQLAAAVSANTVEDSRKPLYHFQAYDNLPCYTIITGQSICCNRNTVELG